jgi:hypothetical protein
MLTRRAALGAMAGGGAGLLAMGPRLAAASVGTFSEPLRWAMNEHNTGLIIPELSRVWDDSPQGSGTEYYETSPDLRLPPYNVPAEAIAVAITMKLKVQCKTWSAYVCDGTLAVHIGKIGGVAADNFNGYNRQSKPKSQTTLTVEQVNYPLVFVHLVDGKFEMHTSISIQNHIYMSRDLFLTGYGVV